MQQVQILKFLKIAMVIFISASKSLKIIIICELFIKFIDFMINLFEIFYIKVYKLIEYELIVYYSFKDIRYL